MCQKMMLFKKDVYNTKIKNIKDKINDITKLATNTILNATINEVKGEIPTITNLATATAFNAIINEVKNKISNITNLATTAALTIVEDKILNVTNLVKKNCYNTKNSKFENKIATDHNHDKYITIQEFNKLTVVNFTARLAQANSKSKIDTGNTVQHLKKYKKSVAIFICKMTWEIPFWSSFC